MDEIIKESGMNSSQGQETAPKKTEPDKMNVLILGPSGSGKSTLVNALMGDDPAAEGLARGKHTRVYESDDLPFRMIDTYGLDLERLGSGKRKILPGIPGMPKDPLAPLARARFRNNLRIQTKVESPQMIWFCLDIHTRKAYRKTIDILEQISAIWDDIPILLLLTQSYSEDEIPVNQQLFRDVLNESGKRDDLNLRGVISIVAKPYTSYDGEIIPPRRLDDLMTRTLQLMPDAEKLGGHAAWELNLRAKRLMANGIVTGATASASVVGAVPISFSDSLILVPIQTAMLYGIARVYEIRNHSAESDIVNAIIKVGLTTAVGRGLLSALKMVPVVGTATIPLNALVAGTVTFAAGQISITIFDKVVRGELDVDQIDWNQYVTAMFQKVLPRYGATLAKEIEKTDLNTVIKKLVKILAG